LKESLGQMFGPVEDATLAAHLQPFKATFTSGAIEAGAAGEDAAFG
jgi:hypothetical protein